ncbi:hypothetical protein K438DRAFT_1763087 [Mycena galopus ATCC 62051]|nr:hypothetical protein K438DRAFT_1763087 [Mycena galopus ATCC 62051]
MSEGNSSCAGLQEFSLLQMYGFPSELGATIEFREHGFDWGRPDRPVFRDELGNKRMQARGDKDLNYHLGQGLDSPVVAVAQSCLYGETEDEAQEEPGNRKWFWGEKHVIEILYLPDKSRRVLAPVPRRSDVGECFFAVDGGVKDGLRCKSLAANPWWLGQKRVQCISESPQPSRTRARRYVGVVHEGSLMGVCLAGFFGIPPQSRTVAVLVVPRTLTVISCGWRGSVMDKMVLIKKEPTQKSSQKVHSEALENSHMNQSRNTIRSRSPNPFPPRRRFIISFVQLGYKYEEGQKSLATVGFQRRESDIGRIHTRTRPASTAPPTGSRPTILRSVLAACSSVCQTQWSFQPLHNSALYSPESPSRRNHPQSVAFVPGCGKSGNRTRAMAPRKRLDLTAELSALATALLRTRRRNTGKSARIRVAPLERPPTLLFNRHPPVPRIAARSEPDAPVRDLWPKSKGGHLSAMLSVGRGCDGSTFALTARSIKSLAIYGVSGNQDAFDALPLKLSTFPDLEVLTWSSCSPEMPALEQTCRISGIGLRTSAAELFNWCSVFQTDDNAVELELRQKHIRI